MSKITKHTENVTKNQSLASKTIQKNLINWKCVFVHEFCFSCVHI